MLASLDVESLFTTVPVREAIDVTAELLYTSGVKMLPVDRTTFTELLEFVKIIALFLTEFGYYRQADDATVGNPLGPLLADVFMSQFDEKLALIRDFNSVMLMTY